ncbi:hypothetical protein IT411_03320, partial [Candidatus Peregrinibacteria bacterium]|nr:hypothetical protein [Candidatus Peregrinibacteria bacterium]
MTKNPHKNRLYKTFLTIVLLAALLLPMKGLLILAQQTENSAVPSQISAEELLRQGKTTKFLDRLKAEIDVSQDDLMSINKNIADTQDKIAQTEDKIGSLNEQLENLDKQINASETLIANVEAQIEKKQSDVDTLAYQIEQKKIEISFQKKMIMEYLRAIFKDSNDFQNLSNDEGEISTIKLILDSDTTSEKLRALKYSEVLEKEGREIFEKLESL